MNNTKTSYAIAKLKYSFLRTLPTKAWDAEKNYLLDLLYSRKLRTESIKKGAQPLTRSYFHQMNPAKTMFILGSGSSINSLTEEHFDIIRSNHSIAFNYFHLGEFPVTPDIYSWEIPKNKKLIQLFYKAWNYKHTKLITNGSFAEWNNHIVEFESRYFYPISIPSPDETFFRRKIKSDIIYSNNIELLVHHYASITALIHLAYQLGFKKIVLCGIDLEGPYFHHERGNKWCEEFVNLASIGKGQHPTDYSTPGVRIPVSKALQIIHEELKDIGVELLTFFDVKKLPELKSAF